MHDHQLPIIDWQQHAQTSSGATDMSKELLRLFIQQLPELEEKLQQAFSEQDKEALQAVLHRLQGACAYCGLPRLRSTISKAGHSLKQTGQVTTTQYELIQQEIAIAKTELAKHGI